jgi:hypothetical protein
MRCSIYILRGYVFRANSYKVHDTPLLELVAVIAFYSTGVPFGTEDHKITVWYLIRLGGRGTRSAPHRQNPSSRRRWVAVSAMTTDNDLGLQNCGRCIAKRMPLFVTDGGRCAQFGTMGDAGRSARLPQSMSEECKIAAAAGKRMSHLAAGGGWPCGCCARVRRDYHNQRPRAAQSRPLHSQKDAPFLLRTVGTVRCLAQ